jgi:tetratricopeptide (TPR) repeat protein
MAKLAAPAPHLVKQFSEAVALHRQGRLDEAEKLYNRVLKAQRDNFDALHLLGVLNQQRGKAGEAHRLIAAALKLNPRSPEALSSHAMALHALKRDAEALESLDKALSIAPGHLDALGNRGILLIDLNRPAEALTAFDQVLAQAPRHLQSHINRGNALAALDRYDAAVADYDAVLAVEPKHPVALYNRGNALRGLGRNAEAVASYDRALAIVPSHVSAWYNRGLALQALNRHGEALMSFEKALALEPGHADAHFGAASAHLTLGQYSAGFREYEWRWKRSGAVERPRLRQPLWLGEYPLAGKTILLHAEQGLGDTIQFARYAPLLARASANVVLEVQPELKTLLAGIEGVIAVIGRGEPRPSFDVHCPLASLPLALRTGLASVPADIPYLWAAEDRIAKWRQRFEAVPRPLVALAWAGRATHVNDRNRSIALSDLQPLLTIPGMQFVSVQRELRAEDAAELNRHGSLLQIGNELTDFADTAAVLALVDLLVSVDTAVAHLAGALGRPAVVLLPFQPDWRWTLDRETSPWYPAMRLCRQAAPGDWADVVRRLCEMLASRAAPVT